MMKLWQIPYEKKFCVSETTFPSRSYKIVICMFNSVPYSLSCKAAQKLFICLLVCLWLNQVLRSF